MKKYLITGIMLATLLAVPGCKEKTEEKVLTREIPFTKEGELEIKRTTNDSLIAKIDIEFAETDYEVQTGLMYRKGMKDNQGMLFIFDRPNIKNFYMKNTEFPLDIIFLNEKMEIVNVQRDAQPFNQTTLSSGVPAQYVLEVNAGLTARWKLLPKDVISFVRK